MAIYLFTDGEDPNVKPREIQEARLDQLFQRRSEQGLGQTVICRRWGTANADLVARLQRGKHAA